VHGYAVENDLAVHYRFSDLVLISLTGVPPDEKRGRAFDIALQFLAPLAIIEAPTHAAVLARLCGARTSAILGVASIALAERARHVVSRHCPFLVWLEGTSDDVPLEHRSQSAADRDSVSRLESALQAVGVQIGRLHLDLSRWAALFVTLHFAGLRRADQIETVLVTASLATTMAEARAHDPGAFTEYPMNTPAFVYEEES
jgi:hypothetical protein